MLTTVARTDCAAIVGARCRHANAYGLALDTEALATLRQQSSFFASLNASVDDRVRLTERRCF